MAVIHATYNYRPFCLVLENEAGEIKAGLPIVAGNSFITGKRLISLPFSDYCSPLYSDHSYIAPLNEAIHEYFRKSGSKSLEIRFPLPGNPSGLSHPEYFIHRKKLSSNPEDLFDTFEKKFRQYPRKAEREGLSSKVSQSWESVEQFYELHLRVRRKLGVPIQPKRFFNNLWKEIIQNHLGKVILVSFDDKPVSGAVVMSANEKAMIKYSATNPEFLRTRAHYFTFWKCIEWACNAGNKVLDFGRTDIEDKGLRFFKMGWNPEEEELAYTIIPENKSGKTTSQAEKLMKTVIKFSPKFVCRLSGELFYKFAA